MEAVIRVRGRGELKVPTNALKKGSRNPYDSLRIWSAITHGIGASLAMLGTVVLLLKCIALGCEIKQTISIIIYGVSMVCLYMASTLYHSIRVGVRGRIMLRKFDHSSIYLLIAGTYTPICVIVLRGLWGQYLLGAIWTFAVAGIILSILWINCPRSLSAVIYIAMGWTAVIAIQPILQALGREGMFWLLQGGILYTVGGVFYALKWPGKDNPRFGCHEVFHLFVLLGSAAHFVLVYDAVL